MSKTTKKQLDQHAKLLFPALVAIAADLKRMETSLGLKPITKQELVHYNNIERHEHTNFDKLHGRGSEILEGHGFFDWINDNIVSPTYGVVKDIVSNPVVGAIAPLAIKAITGFGDDFPRPRDANGVLHSDGSAARIGGKEKIGGKQKIGGSNEFTMPTQREMMKHSTGANKDDFEVGKYYTISGVKHLMTENGFVIAPKMRGGAYLDEDGNVVVSAKKGLLGSTANRGSRNMDPRDWVQ